MNPATSQRLEDCKTFCGCRGGQHPRAGNTSGNPRQPAALGSQSHLLVHGPFHGPFYVPCLLPAKEEEEEEEEDEEEEDNGETEDDG